MTTKSSNSTLSKGRPPIYANAEERLKGHRNSALKAYLKKTNRTMEDYLQQKQQIKKKKEINYVNRWMKDYLKDNDEYNDLLEFIQKQKNNVQQ